MFFGRFHNLNIGKKLIFVIVLSSLVVFLCMCLVVFSLTKESTVRSIRDIGYQQISEGRRIADNACSYLRGIADIYSSDSFVQSCARNGTRLNGQRNNARLQEMLQSQRYMLNAVIYNLDGAPVSYMAIDGSHGPVGQAGRAPFEALRSERKSYQWEYIDEGSDALFVADNSPKICLWHTIKGSNNSSIIGVMAISMDIRRLLRFDMPFNSNYYRQFFLLEEGSGMEISNYTSDHIPPETARVLIDNIASEGSSANFTFRSEGQLRYLFGARILDTSLYVCCAISGDNVGLYDRSMRLTMLLAVIAFLASTVPMLMYVYRRLTKPLELLSASMNSFAEGNFQAKLRFDSDDDIGRLARTFNRMVEDNHALIEKTYVSQLRAQEAELQLLQSQINPHFIYNLTNSIQWAALRHGEQEIADAAYSLGQMLRLCLNRGENIITVERECELVGCYLQLQKTRYADRIQYEIEVEDAAWDALIPKLIIQPLVENSIVHGAANKGGATKLCVTASAADGRLRICVEDDGAGIPPEVLKLLPDRYRSRSASSSGYAIRNINERLKLMYGQDFSFIIESEAQRGTRIRIELPLKLAEEGEEDIHAGPDHR